MENSEASGWLDYSLASQYIYGAEHLKLITRNEEIGRLLGHMINNPGKY